MGGRSRIRNRWDSCPRLGTFPRKAAMRLQPNIEVWGHAPGWLDEISTTGPLIDARRRRRNFGVSDMEGELVAFGARRVETGRRQNRVPPTSIPDESTFDRRACSSFGRGVGWPQASEEQRDSGSRRFVVIEDESNFGGRARSSFGSMGRMPWRRSSTFSGPLRKLRFVGLVARGLMIRDVGPILRFGPFSSQGHRVFFPVCQSPRSWGQVWHFSPPSWGHLFATLTGPPFGQGHGATPQ